MGSSPASNAPLIALFKLLGPGFVRIGANDVDACTWVPSATPRAGRADVAQHRYRRGRRAGGLPARDRLEGDLRREHEDRGPAVGRRSGVCHIQLGSQPAFAGDRKRDQFLRQQRGGNRPRCSGSRSRRRFRPRRPRHRLPAPRQRVRSPRSPYPFAAAEGKQDRPSDRALLQRRGGEQSDDCQHAGPRPECRELSRRRWPAAVAGQSDRRRISLGRNELVLRVTAPPASATSSRRRCGASTSC